MPEYLLSHVMERLGVAPSMDQEMVIRGVADLEEAGPDQIAFAEDARLLEKARQTHAGLLLLPPDFPEVPGIRQLRLEKPRLAFLKVAELFVIRPGGTGIDPHAVIDPDAHIEAEVTIGPCAVVSRGAHIGRGSYLGPGAFVGEGVIIGRDCRIDANASLLPGVTLGDRVVVRCNASIGGEGFGFVWLGDHHHPVPQLGRVEIEDDVEIGCNSCVDRATLGMTRIGRGSKIDNQVHVAHNCHIGEHVILVAQVGLSGSVTVGAGAVLAGKVGAVDHVAIGPGARVGGRATVTKDITPGETVLGSPARPMKRVLKEQASLARLPETLQQIKAMREEMEGLRCRLTALEKGGSALSAESAQDL